MQKAKELEEIKNTLTAREDFLQKQPKASKAKNKIQVCVCLCVRARVSGPSHECLVPIATLSRVYILLFASAPHS
jgi:hypothetical protein